MGTSGRARLISLAMVAPSRRPRWYSRTTASTGRDINIRRPSEPLVAVASSYPCSCNKLSCSASRWIHRSVLLVAMGTIYIRQRSSNAVQNCSTLLLKTEQFCTDVPSSDIVNCRDISENRGCEGALRIPRSALFAPLVAQPQSVLRHLFLATQRRTDGMNPQPRLSNLINFDQS